MLEISFLWSTMSVVLKWGQWVARNASPFPGRCLRRVQKSALRELTALHPRPCRRHDARHAKKCAVCDGYSTSSRYIVNMIRRYPRSPQHPKNRSRQQPTRRDGRSDIKPTKLRGTKGKEKQRWRTEPRDTLVGGDLARSRPTRPWTTAVYRRKNEQKKKQTQKNDQPPFDYSSPATAASPCSTSQPQPENKSPS